MNKSLFETLFFTRNKFTFHWAELPFVCCTEAHKPNQINQVSKHHHMAACVEEHRYILWFGLSKMYGYLHASTIRIKFFCQLHKRNFTLAFMHLSKWNKYLCLEPQHCNTFHIYHNTQDRTQHNACWETCPQANNYELFQVYLVIN